MRSKPAKMAVNLAILGLVGVSGCGESIPSSQPLPKGVSFSGTWDTNWGQMSLRQKGKEVEGTVKVFGQYKGFRNGSVSGKAVGNVFLFNWTQFENRQHGRGYLRMSPDGNRLEGRWGYLKNRTNGGRWWATRARNN